MKGFDTAVVGGGLVGSAIAYGIAREGGSVALIDEGDVALRASRGNFALVWLQGKGDGMARYAAWTRESADLWPDFAGELGDRTGVDVAYEKPGGVFFCLDDAQMAERLALLKRLEAAAEPPGYDFEMMDRKALADMLPGLGEDLVGGSFCPHDGHCNSLMLLRALHAGLVSLGGRYLPGRPVAHIARAGDGFTLTAGADRIAAGRVVLAAGHGSPRLAPMVGLRAPVAPNLGQVLVTERLAPVMRLPTNLVRQTREGTLMIGDSREDAGFDDGTSAAAMGRIAARARRVFPFLAGVRIVRVWGCLRIMPPDGFAIYDRSKSHPNAYLVTCHSGVTLAAVHAERLAGWICAGELPDGLHCFSADRFDVREAA